MKNIKASSISLYNKKRFDWMEKERTSELRKLTIGKAAKLQESILLFFENFQKGHTKDNPVSYEILLKRR